MRLHRFYVLQPLGEEVVINDVSIIKQWLKVFRYNKGDFVILFNGDGDDVTYCIESVSPKECALTRTKLTPSYIPDKKVTLYLSVIKKDNFELVVQKATELGVSAIIPILSERSEKKNLNEERLKIIAIEASEQCGRGDVPTILPIISLSDVLETPSPHQVSLVLQMGGISIKDISSQEILSDSKNVALFVGPEGGWSENEEKLFKDKGVMFVSLGKTILRAETASIVACAFVVQQ
ncbi:MAG: RsmE family RNA methyltransferase [Candidatus Paceibacterota bacterium]|jgi:16S rRNA (uracil1498-N3)-methyltransferase